MSAAIASWDLARSHLRGKYQLAYEANTRIGLLWRIPAEPAPVSQREVVELVQAFGKPHLLIACEVVSGDAMSPLEAVTHNAHLAVGSLALVGNTYVLRAVLPLEGTDPGVFDRALEFVAHEAARLRTLRTQKLVSAPYYD